MLNIEFWYPDIAVLKTYSDLESLRLSFVDNMDFIHDMDFTHLFSGYDDKNLEVSISVVVKDFTKDFKPEVKK